EAARDLKLLRAEMIRRERRVGVGVAVGAHLIQHAHELGVPRSAFVAVGQVLGRRRIGRLAVSLREVALDEAVVGHVTRMTHHSLPPSSPRSLRAARNRWTRTVDSLMPVIALTSRGVQSPK